ncbi:hypothetical protein MKY88_17075 [Lysinibacillus sp. FSL R7-0073]|uniref:hypothetical protein n=1 Tax=Lysinibacillus sp. FSL R7-0073 TaxID=2921669 RepID=UPI0030F64CEA
MNETKVKPRSLTSFTSMFEEIRNNYGIDLLRYDSLDEFLIAFLTLSTEQQVNTVHIPSELVYVNRVYEKMK